MTTHDVLRWMIGRDGWATLPELIEEFEYVEPSDLVRLWHQLMNEKKIGILLHHGVFLIHKSAIIYSITREPHPDFGMWFLKVTRKAEKSVR